MSVTNEKNQVAKVVRREGLHGRSIKALKVIAKELGCSGYSKFLAKDREALEEMILQACTVVLDDDQLTPATEEVVDMPAAPSYGPNRRERRATNAMINKATDEQCLEFSGMPKSEIDAIKIQGDLEREAEEWRARKRAELRLEGMKNKAISLVASYEGGHMLSKATNPVVENGPKVRLHGLSPKLIEVEGKVLWSPTDDPEEFTNYSWAREKIKIAATSPFAKWVSDPDIPIELVVIPERGNLRTLVYERFAYDLEAHDEKKIAADPSLTDEDRRYAIGNFKSGDQAVIGVASIKTWKKYLGDDIRKYSNPNKPMGLTQTPHNNEAHAIEGAKYLRVRVINDEFFGSTPGTKDSASFKTHEGATKTYPAYPVNDGNMLCLSGIFHTSVREANKQRDDEKRYEREKLGIETIKASIKKPYKAKETRVNGNAQIRVWSVVDEEAYADSVKLNKDNPDIKIFNVGEVLPMPKVKVMAHHARALSKFEEYGFDIYAQDAIMGISNFKTRKDDLKHGDIVLIPIKDIRWVTVKQKDGKSSIGIQCQRLAWDITKELINTALPKAQVVVDALKGDMEAFINVLQSDEDTSFEDAPLMYVKSVLFAIKEDGKWRTPMYQSMHRVIMARIYSYLIQHVYKVRLSDYAFYLECNEELDKMEIDHYEKTGKRVYFFRAPTKNKLTKIQRQGIHNPETGEMVAPKWNIGRNPMVGPGNLMGMEWAGENGTTDCIEVSSRALWTMFGDVDGDTCIVFPHYKLHYPVYTRPLPIDTGGSSKDAALPSPREFTDMCIKACALIVESAANTGILDNLGRQIIAERAVKGDRMSDYEVLDMGDKIQGAIDGMKHSDQGALGYDSYLKQKYGVLSYGLKHAEVREALASSDIELCYDICRKVEAVDPTQAGWSNLSDQLIRARVEILGRGTVSELKDSPAVFRALRKDGGVSGSNLAPSRALIHIMNNLRHTEDIEGFPYQDMFKILKHVETRIIHRDASIMRERCWSEWRRQQSQLGSYPWSFKDINAVADALMNGNESFTIGIQGYSHDSAVVRELSTKMEPDERREAYAQLNQKYANYIDDLTSIVINHYVEKGTTKGADVNELAIMFKRHVMLCVGRKAFKSGVTVNEETHVAEPWSTAGNCFWCFPMFDCLVWFAKQFNADHPYMEQAEETVRRYVIKRDERIADKEMDALGVFG